LFYQEISYSDYLDLYTDIRAKLVTYATFEFWDQDQDQDTGLRMPNKWHMCKEGKTGNKKRQRRGLLVFSELPSLPSAGSRPGCFHTSLGCEPRSLIRVSLVWFDYSKNVKKGNPTSAYSPVSDRRRLTALVEVHWARRVQASMPLGPYDNCTCHNSIVSKNGSSIEPSL
jgi:hypothetical protein